MPEAKGPALEVELTAVIKELGTASREVAAAFARDRTVLRRFLDPTTGLLKRRVESKNGSATCTGFTLYYLSGASLLGIGGVAPDRDVVLTDSDAKRAIEALGEKIQQHAPASDVKPEYPNQYNTPIRLAGYLKAKRYYAAKTTDDVKESALQDVAWIVTHLSENGGFARRLGDGPKEPNSYLTFWCGAAVYEALLQFNNDVKGKASEKPSEVLLSVSKWSETEIARKIAYHHSGLTSRFDTVELLYCSLVSLLLAPDSAEVHRLVRHALGIVVSRPYFSDGCFMPSTPVLADANGFILQCPTAEVLGLLLSMPLGSKLANPIWKPLYLVYHWLSENRRMSSNQCEGWCPEGLGRQGDPTTFMSTSALTTLKTLADLLDDALDVSARGVLGVTDYSEDEKLKLIQYPSTFGKIVDTHVIKPLTATPRRDDLASYSLILFGPPGTSKTTIAAKIAQDLKWPLLALGQSDFLRSGLDNIDAEAEKLFRLLSCLKDVVVLFDEIEELVQSREGPEHGASTDKLSRLLTTSMLPRLHHLRDGKRIVFILATNRLASIDSAAARRGRFDIVHGVLPPTEAERETLMDSIMKARRVPDDAQREFIKATVPIRTEGFGYADLDAAVRAVLIQAELLGGSITEALIREIVEDGKKALITRDLEGFKAAKEQHDRPKS